MAANPTAYLQVDHLTKSFGDLVLFEDISFGVAEGQRIALIAQNGKGKSTLLSILSGQADYDSGSVVYRRGLRVAHLVQDPEFQPGQTVFQACFGAVGSANGPSGSDGSYGPAASDNPSSSNGSSGANGSSSVNGSGGLDYPAVPDGDQLWDGYEHDGLDHEVRVKQILTRLNIPRFDQPLDQLSGGERKRVALARELIKEPQLLILDEPTNHLDLEMTEWLENYLLRSGITLLMVTHDRYFLDRVCTVILEIDNRQLYAYEGNYSYYLEKRQQRIDHFNAELERANNLFRYELDWMRRMPCARGTKARARKDAFHELEDKVRQRRVDENVRLDVKATYIGSKIFEARYISKSFGDKAIVKDFYYNFARYEKVGIIGRNGSGKSTFLKMLLGLEPCDGGSFDIGQTVVFGYYSQDGLRFDEGKKVIDIVTDIAEEVRLGDGRRFTASQFLNHFLFSPEKQHSYVAKLSGGERRRLYLCTVLMRSPNFLVLDEPTNDLDIVTLNILEEYLRSFKGCVLVVSHDRYFMDKIVDHLLVFKGGGEVQDFPGNYSQYREWREGEEARLRREKEAARNGGKNSDRSGSRSHSGQGAASQPSEHLARRSGTFT